MRWGLGGGQGLVRKNFSGRVVSVVGHRRSFFNLSIIGGCFFGGNWGCFEVYARFLTLRGVDGSSGLGFSGSDSWVGQMLIMIYSAFPVDFWSIRVQEVFALVMAENTTLSQRGCHVEKMLTGRLCKQGLLRYEMWFSAVGWMGAAPRWCIEWSSFVCFQGGIWMLSVSFMKLGVIMGSCRSWTLLSPKEKIWYPVSSHLPLPSPQLLETTDLQYISLVFPILDISYKENEIIGLGVSWYLT